MVEVKPEGPPAEVGELRAALAAAGARVRELEAAEAQRATGLDLALRQERDRIAQEIHDGVSQNLALLLLRLELISRLVESDPGRVKAELARTVDILEATVHSVREAVLSLRSTDPPREP